MNTPTDAQVHSVYLAVVKGERIREYIEELTPKELASLLAHPSTLVWCRSWERLVADTDLENGDLGGGSTAIDPPDGPLCLECGSSDIELLTEQDIGDESDSEKEHAQ